MHVLSTRSWYAEFPGCQCIPVAEYGQGHEYTWEHQDWKIHEVVSCALFSPPPPPPHTHTHTHTSSPKTNSLRTDGCSEGVPGVWNEFNNNYSYPTSGIHPLVIMMSCSYIYSSSLCCCDNLATPIYTPSPFHSITSHPYTPSPHTSTNVQGDGLFTAEDISGPTQHERQ